MSRNISAEQAHAWLKSGEAILIDVREPDEFKAEHISYASSMPLSRLEEILKIADLPSDRKIIFQCLKGKRGLSACDIFADCGTQCETYYNIEDGIDGWKKSGFPVISWVKQATISVFRQVQIIVGLLILLAVMVGLSGVTLGFIFAGIFAGLLFFAGLTGWCGLAMLLQRMPWNK